MLLFIFLLPYAPYKLWESEKKRADTLESEIEPVLEVVWAKEEAGVLASDTGWGLIVRNKGLEKAHGCSARIEELVLEQPRENVTLTLWPTDRPLHWAGQESETYDIPGGQTAHLNVIYYESYEGKQRVTMAYRGTTEFRFAHALPTGVGPILASINLTNDGFKPQYLVCRIDPKLAESLIHQGLTKQAPFSILQISDEKPTICNFQAPEKSSL